MAAVSKSLAEIWEGNAAVRARTRNEGQLCIWQDRNVVGVPSSAACVLNSIPLTLCADWWTDKQRTPAAIPINIMREEATLAKSCHVKTHIDFFMAELPVCKRTDMIHSGNHYLHPA